MTDIYVVPMISSDKMNIGTLFVESSAWVDSTFPCYKMSSYEMQLSLKMKSYMDAYEDEYVLPSLNADPGNSKFGGLVGFMNGTN